MLESAPHRGEVRATWEAGPIAAGVQARPECPPFVAPGLHVTDQLVVVSAGSVYRGDSAITGDEAAATLAESYRRSRGPGVQSLRGSFSAVIVERGSGFVRAIRSSIGERPLFWRRRGELVAVATEPKQLVAAPLPPASIDHEGVLDLVALRFDRLERTGYQGVHRLLPGQWLEIDDGEREMWYWQPEVGVGTRAMTFPEAARGFRRLLRQAVARRVTEGMALLMSGGLDSTAVAVEAASLHLQRFGTPLRLVSAAYPGQPAADETDAIRAMARSLGLEVLWVRPRPRPFRDLERRARLHDGPDQAPLSSNLEEILAAARESGIAAAMDGHDGDTVLGLPYGLVTALLRRGRLATALRRAEFMGRRWGVSSATALRRVLVPAVIDVLPLARRAWSRLRPPPDPWPNWIRPPLRQQNGKPGDWKEEQVAGVTGPLVVALEGLERTALACGVHLLHPFCDPDLVEFLLGLAPEIKFAGGATKALTRMAYPELPPEVGTRFDKTVFNDVASDGASTAEILAQLRACSIRLSGIDWDSLRSRLEERDISVVERSFLVRVISAERFLEGR
jgi:asparagine synthase (glutamine-hydrolysing)